MKIITKNLIAFLFGLIVLNPLVVFAQATSASPANPNSTFPTSIAVQQPATDSTEGLPVYNGGVDQSIQDYLCTPSEPADGHDLERCVNRLYRFSITAGAIVVLFLIVFAGYIYITGGESGKTSAKKYINTSLTGMAVLLGSYILLYFINPSLVLFKPIQPPIFNAENLPSCADVGFGERCLVESGGGISTGGGGECSIPIAESSLNGSFNNTIHGRKGHGPVRSAPNSPTGEGIVDVGAKGGSPVFSAISGKVVKISPLQPPLGSYASIISDTSGGAFDCQKSSDCANEAHIDFSVKVGDIVKAGQQIGVLATYTGGMGPHLHLELKLGGQWIMGDGFKKTWENQKAACLNAKGVGGGTSPAGMVAVKGIVVDMQYASANPTSYNFTKQALYVGNFAQNATACNLTPEVAKKVEAAQAKLTEKKKGWKIKAWDCLRPPEIQKKLKEAAIAQGTPSLAADPGKGQHPKGEAIDATLVDENNRDVEMPTHFDYYNVSEVKKGQSFEKQRPGSSAYNATPKNARDNAALLKEIMNSAGLTRVCNEWWHFSSPAGSCSS